MPSERTKNGRAHALPLAPMTLDIIKTMPRLSDTLAFPARGNEDATFSGWSKAKSQLDEMAGVYGSRPEPKELHDKNYCPTK